jgi:hypothetical protein
MAAMDVEALCKRYDRAEVKRSAFAALMQDCYAYAMPERDAWSSYGIGQDRNAVIYDSTALVAVPRFATRLQTALFPPQQRWAQLAVPPEYAAGDDDAVQELRVNLEAATERMFRHIHASNFDQAVAEWGQDLAAGVGCMMIEDGRFGQRRRRGPRLRFVVVPSALIAFDEGPFGTIEGVFFKQIVKARLVERTYPDATLPRAVTDLARDEPDADVELLQCTYYDPDDDAWRLEVLVQKDKERIVQRRYRTNPWVITRWSKAPGETHGRGPLTQALPDIRTVNKLQELALKSGALGVSGVWTAVDDGVLNPDTIRIAPGVVIPVASNATGGRGPSLKGLEMPANFQMNEVMQDKLKTTIRQILFDDPLPPEIQAGLTATEVVERVRRFQADTGAFGRLQAEAVVPIVARVLDILEEAGELAAPELKGLVQALQEELIHIVATSPLSLAQDRADVQAIFSVIMGLAQMGDLGLQLLQRMLDMDRTATFIAERSGVPAVVIPTAKELRARQDKADAAAQQQQMLKSPVVGQAVGALGNVAAKAMPVGAEAA